MELRNGRFWAFISIISRDLRWLWKVSPLNKCDIMKRTLALDPIVRNWDTLTIRVNCVVAICWNNFILDYLDVCIDPFIWLIKRVCLDLLMSLTPQPTSRWTKYLISFDTTCSLLVAQMAMASIIFFNNGVTTGSLQIRDRWIAHTCFSQDVIQIFLLSALWCSS